MSPPPLTGVYRSTHSQEQVRSIVRVLGGIPARLYQKSNCRLALRKQKTLLSRAGNNSRKNKGRKTREAASNEEGPVNEPECASGAKRMKVKDVMIRDVVHGSIKLSPLCKAIMDTPQFQRLRDIKQLGGALYVYPGGSHSRFEHSLGVCHLARRLVKTLRENQPELGITPEDILCVEIAALCHDLGHGPYSHAFDMRFLPSVGKNVKHDRLSCDMFHYMLEREEALKAEFELKLDDEDKEFIKLLILGSPKADTGTAVKPCPEKRREDKMFLYDIVNNKLNGVDVDKWDYFVRDCHHLGIGTDFQYDRLIEASRVVQVDVNGTEGSVRKELHICWRDKEIFNVYQMFHTRYTLHKRVYQHKVIKAAEMMIVDAMLEANPAMKLKGKERKCTMAESVEDMEAYSKLTDSVFYKIKNLDEDDLENLHEDELKDRLRNAREILLNLERRKLYKIVAQSPPIPVEKTFNNRDLEEAIKDEIVKEMPQTDGQRLKDRIRVLTVSFSSGLPREGTVWQYTKKDESKAEPANTKDVSLLGFPEKLSGKELLIQVYFVPSAKETDADTDREMINGTFEGQKWDRSRVEKLLERLQGV